MTQPQPVDGGEAQSTERQEPIAEDGERADGLLVSEIAKVHRDSEVAWRAWRDKNWNRVQWAQVKHPARIHAAFLSGFAAGRSESA